MVIRGTVVFFVAWLLLRIAGKRTFGQRAVIDYVIMIMLGAILSRAVIGASPFVPTLTTSAVIIIIHKFLAWVTFHNHKLGNVIKGDADCLYRNGKLVEENMKTTLITREDIMEGVRTEGNVSSLEEVEEVFIERNGDISIIKKST